jgi:hypothetical protein
MTNDDLSDPYRVPVDPPPWTEVGRLEVREKPGEDVKVWIAVNQRNEGPNGYTIQVVTFNHLIGKSYFTIPTKSAMFLAHVFALAAYRAEEDM